MINSTIKEEEINEIEVIYEEIKNPPENQEG